MKKSLISLVCASSALVVLLGACGTGSGAQEGAGSGATQTFAPGEGDGADDTPDAAQATFENGVLTTADVKIEITRHQVIKPGQKGNEYGEKPVLAFWYTITNVSGEDVDPLDFIFHFTAYQDNNPNAENTLDVGGLPDDRFLDSQMETIKEGGTVENAVAYELDDLTTPVDLVATVDMDEEIGKATYQLR